jgi:hypothetical protein
MCSPRWTSKKHNWFELPSRLILRWALRQSHPTFFHEVSSVERKTYSRVLEPLILGKLLRVKLQIRSREQLLLFMSLNAKIQISGGLWSMQVGAKLCFHCHAVQHQALSPNCSEKTEQRIILTSRAFTMARALSHPIGRLSNYRVLWEYSTVSLSACSTLGVSIVVAWGRETDQHVHLISFHNRTFKSD